MKSTGQKMRKTISAGAKKTFNQGFTLIELMIYTVIFGLVLGAIFSAYYGQLQSQVIQGEISEMQQNLRAALFMMEREIKEAGLNPLHTAGIGITSADAHTVTFSMDFTGGLADGIDNNANGIVDEGVNGLDDNANGLRDEPDEAETSDGAADPALEEVVTYNLSNDADNNGLNDGLPTENNTGAACNLMRNGQAMALNIDALNFVYLDQNGNVLPTPVSAVNLPLIRSIQVTLVARSAHPAGGLTRNFVDTQSYSNQRPVVILPTQNDPFRRLMLSTQIRCRNLGL